ncbi:precorrin-3B synthase [Dietzia sp. B32]|uniref:precorrin-3B synthase n=1 Tax=Dietzia sp. B32 TaxID=2915130 RepID=UPI0021ADB9BF|nr:precorrin-3B synthase [Dietzia sp. B32]UVE95412.1 precorrin-3B synthase [Dietzia sp. B32]
MNDSPHTAGSSRTGDTLRFPGGRLRHDHWTALASLAAGHRGGVQLTARGGARIVGADRDPVEVATRDLEAAGLPAGLAHPRARDIIASPMAGRLGGHHDVGDLPRRLEAALLARDEADALHGQMLFGVDDGSGDVLAHSPDLAVVVDGTDGSARVHVAGRAVPYRVAVSDAATVLIDAAVRLTGSAGPTRVPGSGSLHRLVVDALGTHPAAVTAPGPAADAATTGSTTGVVTPRVGWIDTADGLVSLLAVVPDGVVPARLAEFLGAVERPTTISADRVIGLHELTEPMAEQVVRVLAPMGMIFDAESPWAAGAP